MITCFSPRTVEFLVQIFVFDEFPHKSTEFRLICFFFLYRNGCPSARFVLMKGFDEKGLTFFTNYGSRKAKEIVSFGKILKIPAILSHLDVSIRLRMRTDVMV